MVRNYAEILETEPKCLHEPIMAYGNTLVEFDDEASLDMPEMRELAMATIDRSIQQIREGRFKRLDSVHTALRQRKGWS